MFTFNLVVVKCMYTNLSIKFKEEYNYEMGMHSLRICS